MDVLDLGCGEGYGSELLMSSCSALTSLDISDEATRITYGKTGKRVVRADGRLMPFRDNSFDVIVSFEVFEHIENVKKYLTEVFRMLKKGGLFIVSTPNVETYPMAGMNPWHVKEYTVSEVKDLLAGAGLTFSTVYAQIANNQAIEKLQNSKFLQIIMKMKRRIGIHGDLLPAFLQKKVQNAIAGSKFEAFDPNDFRYEENKNDEAELVYIANKT